MKIKFFFVISALLFSNILYSQACSNVVSDFCSVTEGSTTHFSFSGSEEGATSYLWDFGDGTTSTLRNPVHTFMSTGSFQACLTLTCVITTSSGGGGGYGGGGTTTTTTCTDFHCANVSISVNGCTNSLATNYNPLATIDDGTCEYCIYGCTDPTASNYNSLANCDDNSCLDIIHKSIYEDFEDYDLYDYLAFSSPVWQVWSDPSSFVCDEDVRVLAGVLDSNLNGGSNAIKLKSIISSGGPQDIVLPFGTSGSFNSGVFIFSARFNVTTGAYFNFQSDYNPGNGWALDVFMEQNGQIIFSNSQNSNMLTSTYPQDIWFELKIAVDITNNEWYIYIDNVLAGSFSNGINQIASLDLFPLEGNSFWVDEISCMYNSNLIYGCTDSTMFNYDVNASWDDSTCISYIYGCTDSTMFNYDLAANTDDGTCISVIIGCMDSTMWNYNPLANTPTNNCIPFIYGCIDLLACNYDSLANTDDGLCDMPYGCGDLLYVEYNPLVTCSDSLACITLIVNGCIDPNACNYYSLANTDDGSCDYNSESYDTLSSSVSIVWNGLTINASGNYSVTLVNSVGCDSITNLIFSMINTTEVKNIYNNNKVLIKITNFLGKETPYRRNTPLFYIYNDGTVERKLIIK